MTLSDTRSNRSFTNISMYALSQPHPTPTPSAPRMTYTVHAVVKCNGYCLETGNGGRSRLSAGVTETDRPSAKELENI